MVDVERLYRLTMERNPYRVLQTLVAAEVADHTWGEEALSLEDTQYEDALLDLAEAFGIDLPLQEAETPQQAK